MRNFLLSNIFFVCKINAQILFYEKKKHTSDYCFFFLVLKHFQLKISPNNDQAKANENDKKRLSFRFQYQAQWNFSHLEKRCKNKTLKRQ